MAKIVVPKYRVIKAEKESPATELYISERYRQIVEEANKRIKEAHLQESRTYLNAKKFIAL